MLCLASTRPLLALRERINAKALPRVMGYPQRRDKKGHETEQMPYHGTAQKIPASG